MKEYSNKDLIVYWEPERCSHSAICLKRLPSVFDVDRRPWVNINAASPEEIIKTIDECPSGALKYSLPEGSSVNPDLAKGPGSRDAASNAAASLVRIKVIRNGPWYWKALINCRMLTAASSKKQAKPPYAAAVSVKSVLSAMELITARDGKLIPNPYYEPDARLFLCTFPGPVSRQWW